MKIAVTGEPAKPKILLSVKYSQRHYQIIANMQYHETDTWEQHITVVCILLCHGIKKKVALNNKLNP